MLDATTGEPIEGVGGAAGASCAERADAWMRSQGVLNVDRMHVLLVPGVSR